MDDRTLTIKKTISPFSSIFSIVESFPNSYDINVIMFKESLQFSRIVLFQYTYVAFENSKDISFSNNSSIFYKIKV